MRKDDVDLVALVDLVGRVFPPPGRCTVERTEGGVSTQVYRVRREAETFYLRVAEERAHSLAPEAYVHQTLHARGVRVPAVVHFEPFDERLERSVLVTTEIAGASLAHRPVDGTTPEILRAAGRNLAAINSVPVQGFGWIKRDAATDTVYHLEAEHATHRSFALEYLDDDLALLERQALTGTESAAIRDIVDRYDVWLDVEQAWLAHGDFDVSHIYQCEGRYTGIIDFGEIRGAGRLYDLGHFNLHDGETLPQPALPSLLAGYGEVFRLPRGHEQQIAFASVLIGVRALARNIQRRPPNAYQRYLIAALRRCIALLNG